MNTRIPLNLKFYSFSNLPGGENIWLHRIAEKTGSRIITLWDYDTSKLQVQSTGLLNGVISSFVRLISRRNETLARGIYGILGTYSYKLKDRDCIHFVSSSYIPAPRGNNVIVYIHTPSRLLTINFKRRLQSESILSHRLFLLMWRKIYFLFYIRSLKRSKTILVNSKNVQHRLKEYFNIDSHVLYPSQNVESFSCKKFEKFFFFPSRISPEKRQKIAIEAFKLFNEHNQDFRLILASTPLKSKENKDYLEEIEDMIHQNSLPVDIRMGLSRNDIIELYSNCYACLFTAYDEDLGQVPIEAMASSKPVVAIGEGGIKETVTDGQTGFLVNNAPEMAEKMLLLADDIELTHKLGKNGRKIAQDRFSDDVFIQKLFHLCEEIIQTDTGS